MRRFPWPVLWLVLAGVVLVGATVSPLSHHLRKRRDSACAMNVRMLVLAALTYASDHDDLLPVMSMYPDGLLGPLLPERALFCPSDRQHHRPGYAYSPVWAGRRWSKIDEPVSAVLLYDAVGDQPAYRHGDKHTGYCSGDMGPGLLLGYCDGHVHGAGMRSFTMQNVLLGRDSDYSLSHPAKTPTGDH